MEKVCNIVKINPDAVPNLVVTIEETVTNHHNAGYRLASSLVIGQEVVLIFEKKD